MKKIMKITGLCCLAIFIISGIYITVSPKTIDFRGTVTEVETIDNGMVFYISTTESAYIVTANNKTKISYCCKDDPKIDLYDIKVGDTIEGNYRWLSDNTASFITVEYNN